MKWSLYCLALIAALYIHSVLIDRANVAGYHEGQNQVWADLCNKRPRIARALLNSDDIDSPHVEDCRDLVE